MMFTSILRARYFVESFCLVTGISMTSTTALANTPDVNVPGNFATIQAALNTATDVNGDGIISIKVGSGTFTAHLTVNRSNLELVGNGTALTTIRSTGAAATILVNGRTNVKLSDFKVLSNRQGPGIRLLNSSGCTVTNVVANTCLDGIFLDASNHCTIENVVSSNNGNAAAGLGSGINILLGGGFHSLSSLLLENNGFNGISILNSTNDSVFPGAAGVISRMNENGILIRDSANTLVTGITCTANRGNGLRERNTLNCVFSGNTLTNNLLFGIRRKAAVNTDYDGTLAGVQGPTGNNIVTGNVLGVLRQD